MRELFHVPDNYFLSHSVGCLPKYTQSIIQDSFFTPWKSGENWSQWMGIVEDFRRHMAGLLGVKSDTICPQTNISSALTKIIYSQPFDKARNKIVLTRQDFPTIGFVAKQAERAGYEICFVEDDVTRAANSLKGRPVEILNAGLRQKFFPDLWSVRAEMTDRWGGTYGKTRDKLVPKSDA